MTVRLMFAAAVLCRFKFGEVGISKVSLFVSYEMNWFSYAIVCFEFGVSIPFCYCV